MKPTLLLQSSGGLHKTEPKFKSKELRIMQLMLRLLSLVTGFEEFVFTI